MEILFAGAIGAVLGFWLGLACTLRRRCLVETEGDDRILEESIYNKKGREIGFRRYRWRPTDP